VPAIGAGRTDAGVHATGQAVGVVVPERWHAEALRRAMNALLPDAVWIAAAHEMRADFHARYSAEARRYRYLVGLDEAARSPFRRHFEWRPPAVVDRDRLDAEAAALPGEHVFLAYAVKGTAPADDDHRCRIVHAAWEPRPGGLAFVVEANRFLHHMVRFLVGTMMDVAMGRRSPGTVAALLHATDNRDVSVPAPAHGLYLERVMYPASLYAAPAVAA
jgi:tRNA pseudouridine38-40 synthase